MPWVGPMSGFLVFEESGEDEGPAVFFGVGGVAGVFYEFLELFIGDGVGVDLEGL